MALTKSPSPKLDRNRVDISTRHLARHWQILRENRRRDSIKFESRAAIRQARRQPIFLVMAKPLVEHTRVCRHLITMPRYHFHIAGPKVFDILGAVLPDADAARLHAIDLATNVGKHTLEPPVNAVRVIDDEGCVLFRVPIRRSA
jgi:uncharacterized protein DUF6894